jgi:hypothetical protein
VPAASIDAAVAQEQLAWCIAVHAPRELLDRLRAALANGEYELVMRSAESMLPRARASRPVEPVTPVADGDDTLLENGLLHARTNARGVVLELASPQIRVPVSHANIVSGLGRSPSAMRFELRRGEPFLRVALDVEWRAWWGAVRLENWLAMAQARVRFGIERRLAAIEDERAGCVIFAAPGTEWKLRALQRGGAHLSATLLRSRGHAELQWGFAPFEPGISLGALERAWERFAFPLRVRLFTSEDPAIYVTGCAPATDGDGVVVRVRECDGAEREVPLRCGARMREVDGAAAIHGERIVARIAPFEERAFRVRF